MPMYRFAVTETRNVEMEYWVEATTLAEARGKAETGNTVAELEWGVTGVSDRFVAEQLATADGPPVGEGEERTPSAG